MDLKRAWLLQLRAAQQRLRYPDWVWSLADACGRYRDPQDDPLLDAIILCESVTRAAIRHGSQDAQDE